MIRWIRTLHMASINFYLSYFTLFGNKYMVNLLSCDTTFKFMKCLAIRSYFVQSGYFNMFDYFIIRFTIKISHQENSFPFLNHWFNFGSNYIASFDSSVLTNIIEMRIINIKCI